MKIISMLISNRGFYGCYYLIHSLADYASGHKLKSKSMLADVDRKTIARGNDPAVTDSFAIEYKVRPMPGKVTVRTFEAELVSDSNGRKNYKKTDRQKDVTVPYYIDYYPTKKCKIPVCIYS